MAFCAKCGATLTEGAGFCGSCGIAVSPAMQTSNSGVQAVAASGPPMTLGLTPNVAAALSYVLGFITAIVFLVLEPHKHDRFVRFHAMQSIRFCAASIVFSVAWSILVDVLTNISAWTAIALTPIGLVISVGFFVMWLFLMYQAYSGHEFRIPVIGGIAAKQIG